jgi:sigma-B regulation protein RsbU (phosphoserine phosphatase)
MFLFDVAGHGVGASLMSSAIAETLRRRSLPKADFAQPDRVMAALNRAFPMEEHAGRFFTIWYGVYERTSRLMTYASAGHPPAILMERSAAPLRLGQPGLLIGVDVDAVYEMGMHQLAPGARLYLYSDGVTEATQKDGRLVGIEGLERLLLDASAGRSRVEQIYERIASEVESPTLEDDFSLLEVTLG